MSFPEIKIMKIKYSCYMIAAITIAGSQLLKQIHVTELQLISFVDIIMKACKKPVLIKVIINDLLAKVHKHFIG